MRNQQKQNLDDLINRAVHLHGEPYAQLLRADIEIAKRRRAGKRIPPAWLAKRRRMGRELDVARARLARDIARARREFWR